MIVWVIEEGDYEGRSIYGVAESVDAAVEAIKKAFPAPYQVRWMGVTFDDALPSGASGREANLVGHFREVADYSTQHTATFTMTPYDTEKAWWEDSDDGN